ncbi:hypothetical protein FQA39_LY01475 [Lamprigera yunnana]|nr:hypothetical protein FQA39_LY01475 [Lamprigera yunnana]
MYNSEKLRRLLGMEEFKVIDNDGKLLGPSHTVFKNISAEMEKINSKMTAKHVYTSIQKNRHGFLSNVQSTFMSDLSFADNENLDSTYELSVDSVSTSCIQLAKERFIKYSDPKYNINDFKTGDCETMLLNQTIYYLNKSKSKWISVELYYPF